jgi:hypothetical protein
MNGTAEADIFIKKTGVAALYPSNAGDILPETRFRWVIKTGHNRCCSK